MSSKEEKAQSYDRLALEVFAPLYPFVAEKAIARTGIRSGQLLDIGCGGGYLGVAVMEQGKFNGTFLDVNEESLKIAGRHLEERSMTGKLITGDVHSMPFKDATFDLVVSRGSMPFWKNQEIAIGEIWRVLKPDGRAYIGVGYGSSALREQIRKKLKKKDGEKGGPRSRGIETKMFPDNPPYEKILERLGAYYRIFDNDDEGRWFLFGKQSLRK